MTVSKLMSILCCFLLLVCLTLSVTALTVFRNAIAEDKTREAQAEEILSRLEELAAGITQAPKEDIPVSGDVSDVPIEVAVGYTLRAEGNRIGIYTEGDCLIRYLDADLSLLPGTEQTLLREGITVPTYRELLKKLQSYEE